MLFVEGFVAWSVDRSLPLTAQGTCTTFARVPRHTKSDEVLTYSVVVDNGRGTAQIGIDVGTQGFGVHIRTAQVRFIFRIIFLWLRFAESIAHILLEIESLDRPMHLCHTCRSFYSFVVRIVLIF